MSGAAANNKKTKQLGMAIGTASHRLRMDLLWAFVCGADIVCHRCGEEMTRETFSIDHKDDWLDSDDPVERFFDLKNISFSHFSCNYRAARKPTKHSDEDLASLEPRHRAKILQSRRKYARKIAKGLEHD